MSTVSNGGADREVVGTPKKPLVCRCPPWFSTGGSSSWCERCERPKGFVAMFVDQQGESAAFTPRDDGWKPSEGEF